MAGFSVVHRGLDADRDGRGLPSNNVIASGVDALGRTGVLNSSSDVAPTIVGQVSVTDAPWGVKGDTRVATDGVILGGSLNQVSSATLALTSADAGKTVVVLAVGANVQPGVFGPAVPGVFVSTISSVASGTATLAGSATIPGTGLTVKVGTLDSAAIASAIVAASARATAQGGSGVVKLVFPSGRHYLFNNVTAKSNVLLDFTGATLHNAAGNSTGLTTNMMFSLFSNASVTNWHIRGGTWVGTGTEAGSSGCQGIMYWHNAAFGQNGTATYTDISIRDTTVTNWRTGVYDVRGGSRLRFNDNTFKSCSWYTGTNTINVIMGGGASPVNSSDVFVQNNYFDDNGAECVAIGEATSPTGGFNRAIITGNICQNTGGIGFGSINGGATVLDIEWSTVTTGQLREVIISNNVVRQDANPGAGSNFCIGCAGTSMPANVHTEQHVSITGNICISKDGGINVVGVDDAIVANNIIDCASAAGNTLSGIRAGNSTQLAVTADTNSSTTLTNVSVAGGGVAENGMLLSGPGVLGGTYLVSGAGSATWTISQAATTTVAGNAEIGWPLSKRNQIVNNIVHASALITHNPIFAGQLVDSRIAGNIVVCEPGSTATAFIGAGILAQRVGRTDVVDNRVSNAGSYGILLDSSYNSEVERNRVYNPNQANQAQINGITVTKMSGLPFHVRDNYCADDNAVHLMVRAIDVGATLTLPMLVGNDSRGATDTSNPFGILSNYLLVSRNTSDQTGFPAATTGGSAGASPYTTTAVPYPTMVSVVGGTVTTILQNRTGSSSRTLASYGGAGANVTAYLMPNDTITVTWTVVPTVNVFPLQ